VSELDLNDEGEMVNPGELVDINPPKKNPKIGGRPTKSFLDDLTQQCYRKSNPLKHIWRCVADECSFVLASRNSRRVARHAKVCFKLPTNLRKLAAQEAASKAPSQKLLEIEQVAPEIIESPRTETQESRLVQMARITGRKEKHRKLDLAVVKLFCVAGLPTNLAARQEWKDLLAIADPSYKPASRDTLEYEHIPGEQEHVKQMQIAYLKTQEDLTISFDGGTSRGKQSFWTVHVTTAARQVYFIEG
jgi:hypothetical protein